MSNRTDMNTFEEFSNIPNDTVSAFNDKFVTEEQNTSSQKMMNNT